MGQRSLVTLHLSKIKSDGGGRGGYPQRVVCAFTSSRQNQGNSPIAEAQFRDAEKAEIRNHDFAVLQEDVFTFEVFVNDATGV